MEKIIGRRSGVKNKKTQDLDARGYLKSNRLRSEYVRVSPNLKKKLTNSKDTCENLEKCSNKLLFSEDWNGIGREKVNKHEIETTNLGQ